MTGAIASSKFQPEYEVQATTTTQQADAAGFSMLRLRNIAKQRDIFSSLESLSDPEAAAVMSTRRVDDGTDEDDDEEDDREGGECDDESTRRRRKVRKSKHKESLGEDICLST